ncbi:MAG: peroxidase-related enzyme [Nitrospira sp.]|nr:peroxidase-related enzyme [Nitrospira sp.]
MSFLRTMPRASLIDVFRASPEFARPLHEFAQELMRGPSPFTEGERELLAAYVSSLNRCAFCEASHTEVAVKYGYDRQLIQQLALNLAEADVTERLKPVFRYVRKLTLLPAQVVRVDVTAIYEAGWDDTAVSHAALVCAFFSFMNRWVEGLGVQSDPTVVRKAGEMLHKKGYEAVIELLDHARIRSLPVAATGEAKPVSS